MNIVEKEMDAYEIAQDLFNDKLQNTDIFSIQSSNLKEYFEMLLIITMEGLKLYYGNKDGKVDIELLSNNDFQKINTYLKKINIKMNYSIYNQKEWNNGKKNIIKPFNVIIEDKNTNLKDFYFIIEKNNVYVIWFEYIIN